MPQEQEQPKNPNENSQAPPQTPDIPQQLELFEPDPPRFEQLELDL